MATWTEQHSARQVYGTSDGISAVGTPEGVRSHPRFRCRAYKGQRPNWKQDPMIPLPCCSRDDRVDLAVVQGMQLLGDREGLMHGHCSLQPVRPTNPGVWPSWPLAYPGYQSGVISCSFVPPQEKSMQQEHAQLAMCLTCKTQDLSSITNVLKSKAWGQELVMLSTGNWNNSKSQLKTKPKGFEGILPSSW